MNVRESMVVDPSAGGVLISLILTGRAGPPGAVIASRAVRKEPGCPSVFELWPVMFGKQVPQQCRPPASQHNRGVEVRRVHLPHELATAAAGGQHVKPRLLVPPDRDDGSNPVLAGSNHRSDGAVLGTEPRTTPGVYADTAEAVANVGHENRGNVPEQAIPDAARSQNRLGGIGQFCGEVHIHTHHDLRCATPWTPRTDQGWPVMREAGQRLEHCRTPMNTTAASRRDAA